MLAIVVLCLVPLCTIFFGFMSFMGSYQANNTKKHSIDSQIAEQETLQLQAATANVRREYYRQFCLPQDLNRSITQYIQYIENLAHDECGLTLKSTQEKSRKAVNYIGKKGRTKVFDQVSFTLRSTGRLTQITSFLHKFYSLDMLHRISELTIEPGNSPSAGEKEYDRDGTYNLVLNIDVASMADADEAREFENTYRPVEKSLAEYDKAILYRNMFGPPNVAPRISRTKHSLKPSGDTVSFKISAEDKDKNDLLTFELLSCPLNGAKLEQKREKDRSAIFTCPKLAPGTYEFELKVTDTGAPNKSDQQKFTLTIEDNAAPSFTTKSKKLEESMDDISFKVEATDSDRGDQLSFEMLSCEIEGAKFNQSNDRSKYATFSCPAQPAGQYRMVFKVSDNATPSKSTEHEFVLTITESTKARLAPATSIVSVRRVIGGRTSLVLHVRPTNEYLEPAVGDSFELDEKNWTVRSVENRSIQIECEGYLLLFNLKGDYHMLGNPQSRTKIESSAAVDGKEGSDEKLSAG